MGYDNCHMATHIEAGRVTLETGTLRQPTPAGELGSSRRTLPKKEGPIARLRRDLKSENPQTKKEAQARLTLLLRTGVSIGIAALVIALGVAVVSDPGPVEIIDPPAGPHTIPLK